MEPAEKEMKFNFKDEEKVEKITSMNPIHDFEKMIEDRVVDRVDDALKQMRQIILDFIRHSTGGDMYEKALECLRKMRESSKDNDEAEQFNNFVTELKARFSVGMHQDFYETMRTQNIGLITKDESFKSKITKEEADEFFGFQNNNNVQEEVQEDKEEKKETSMFDDLE
mmetsp:Transcript_32113/g.31515  ORF Transcript_32113/g.31515 Transcript_32113/m.31515 type:complete len:169 (-) Transcript_32113:15-521(-)